MCIVNIVIQTVNIVNIVIRPVKDDKQIFRETFMSYKCRDCEMLKLAIKQRF